MAREDRAARLWCENGSKLTGEAWRYRKVPQKEFEELAPKQLADLAGLFEEP